MQCAGCPSVFQKCFKNQHATTHQVYSRSEANSHCRIMGEKRKCRPSSGHPHLNAAKPKPGPGALAEGQIDSRTPACPSSGQFASSQASSRPVRGEQGRGFGLQARHTCSSSGSTESQEKSHRPYLLSDTQKHAACSCCCHHGNQLVDTGRNQGMVENMQPSVPYASSPRPPLNSNHTPESQQADSSTFLETLGGEEQAHVCRSTMHANARQQSDTPVHQQPSAEDSPTADCSAPSLIQRASPSTILAPALPTRRAAESPCSVQGKAVASVRLVTCPHTIHDFTANRQVEGYWAAGDADSRRHGAAGVNASAKMQDFDSLDDYLESLGRCACKVLFRLVCNAHSSMKRTRKYNTIAHLMQGTSNHG
jgi:hypothetical protein